MDPVVATSAAAGGATSATRAADLRSTDPAAIAGGVAAKGTTFTKALQAASEGEGTRGITRQVKDAETHTGVAGHRYSKITAGLREGSYLNTSGNTRHGQAFALVERDGRRFHVYGDGADRRIVEVKTRVAQPAATATPAAATPVATTPTAPAAEADPQDDAVGLGGLEAPEEPEGR